MSGMILSNTFSTLKLLESKLKCFICEGTPLNPHILWCKHSFCKECILKMENCPLCGFKVTPLDLVPDIMFGRLLRLMDAASNLCQNNQSKNTNHTILSTKRKEFKNCLKKVPTALHLKERDACKTRPRSESHALENTEKSALKMSKVRNNQTKLCLVAQEKQSRTNKTPQSSKNELNKVNVKGETPLQIFARQGKLSKVQDLLIKGANPNVKDYAGWTPLCDAVSSGKIEVVQALLEAGAGVNTPAHQNTTALVEAVVKKDKDMIKLLMSYGADMNQRTSLNNTALSIANEEIIAIIRSSKTSIIQPIPQVKSAPQAILMGKLGKNNSEQVDLLSKIFDLTLCTLFTEEVSHIIVECGEDKHCEESLELMQGLLKGCSVVGTNWVTACLAEKKLLSVDEFEPTNIRGQPGNQVFTRARNNRERLLPRLFDGCHISLWHEQNWSSELRQEVKMLVTMGGAKFLPRACDAERIPLDEQTVMFHASPPSPLAYTSHIVLYQPGLSEPQLKYNMEHIKTLPLDWFYSCICSFSILPPNF